MAAPTASAAFFATTPTGQNQFSAAATFPTYSAAVTGDTAWAYHRGDESPSSAATLAAADSSGTSDPGTYNGITNGSSTWWRFNEGSGTTVADSSGAANPGTLGTSPATTWGSGYDTTNGVSLVGDTSGNGYVAGASPAVATNTSFSVAAWVYLTDTTKSRVALSQSSSIGSGFILRYNHYSGAWDFSLSKAESYSPVYDSAYSLTSARTNTWVHLVGVYDSAAAAGQHVKLYVDGVAQAPAGHTDVWSAGGPLQLGRVREFGDWQVGATSPSDLTGWGPWTGRIDEARTWRRALTAAEATALAGDGITTQWDFSEAAGSASTVDLGTRGNTGTLGTGASPAAIAAGGHSGNGVTMSGTANGYVQGSTSAVNTDTSFTVAAWVYLNSDPSFWWPTVSEAVVTQRGSVSSGFILKYNPGRRWAFVMPQSDANTPAVDQVLSTADNTVAGWVHLAGVYDDAANTIRLYVGGADQGSVAHLDANEWNATGALQAGRTWWNGAFADAWNGRLDSIRLYRRALDATSIAAVRDYTNPAGSWTEAAMTLGVPGALQGAQQGQQSSTAAAFTGTTGLYNNTALNNPTTFTMECWFKASGTRGGQLIGFHQTTAGTSGSHDRQLYIDSGGRLTFGTSVSGSVVSLRTDIAYNDGAWHHVAASLGTAGMKLYVDGALAKSSANTAATNFTGYWLVGGGWLAGWPDRPTSDFLVGTIDEVAIYQSQLSDSKVAQHYFANH